MAYADLQHITLRARVGDLKVIKTEDNRDCLVITAYHRISPNVTVTIRFLNSNGLLTAFGNGNLVVGQELVLAGKIQAIRSFYMKDEGLVPLKQPEWQMKVTDYTFGSRPQSKAQEVKEKDMVAVVKSSGKKEPTLEEIEF